MICVLIDASAGVGIDQVTEPGLHLDDVAVFDKETKPETMLIGIGGNEVERSVPRRRLLASHRW